jgi:hypothetical protein
MKKSTAKTKIAEIVAEISAATAINIWCFTETASHKPQFLSCQCAHVALPVLNHARFAHPNVSTSTAWTVT